MKKLSFLTTCLFTLFISQAQTVSMPEQKLKPLIASIKTLDNKTMKGELYAISDSQVVLANSFSGQDLVPAENIQSISFKSKNQVLKSALIGFGMWAAAGILVERLANKHNNVPVGKNNVKAGLIMGGSGALFGALLGAVVSKRFTIRSKKTFNDRRYQAMRRYVQY